MPSCIPYVDGIGQRHINETHHIYQALKGRNQMKQIRLRPFRAYLRRCISYTGRCPVLLLSLFQSFLWLNLMTLTPSPLPFTLSCILSLLSYSLRHTLYTVFLTCLPVSFFLVPCSMYLVPSLSFRPFALSSLFP
jgi:hypothetical protein